MLRNGPAYTMEERRGGFVLVWCERDFALPRRMVASFPPHPHDKHEAAILAEICAEALNRKLPHRVAENPDPELDVPPVAATRKPAAAPAQPEAQEPGGRDQESQERTIHELPLQKSAQPEPPAQPSCVGAVHEPPALPAAPAQPTPLQAYAASRLEQRKAMPDVSGLKGRDKVQAMRATLFGDVE